MVYVQHEAGYFGYFDDPLFPSSANFSREYLFVSLPSVNKFDTSAATTAALAQVGALLTQIPAANMELSYGITSIALSSFTSTYAHLFDRLTGALTFQNH